MLFFFSPSKALAPIEQHDAAVIPLSILLYNILGQEMGRSIPRKKLDSSIFQTDGKKKKITVAPRDI